MDQKFILRAIELAKLSISKGGGPFGAVVTRNGSIVAENHNHVTLNNDPTAHAEVMAIRDACQKLETFDLQGCELYTSCYPCPMCLGAIYWAHIDKVWYASLPQDAAAAGFDDQFIYDELAKGDKERKVQFERLVVKEGGDEFNLWQDARSKVNY
jgi:guanine deaminase